MESSNKINNKNYKKFITRTLVILILVDYVGSSPIQNSSTAMFYLSTYGYLSPKLRNAQSGAIVDEKTWNNAIAEFQSFAGLNVTGQLDKDTIDTMQLPRCGVKDKVGSGSDSRSKRYALQGSRWKVKHLTYKLHKYPKNLNKDDVDKEIAKAFGIWSQHTDLTFEQKKSGNVHIDISFERGEHGDGDPFDGPGGTLAHAYFPVFGGDAHFDASEQWTINQYRGTNLLQVAAHEFGHSLGLSHSDVRSALMAPFYRGYDPIFELDDDDVLGIQRLYGQKTKKTVPSGADDESESKPKGTSANPPKEDSTLCHDPSFDTIFNSAGGDTLVFKGSNYWKLNEDSVEPGYPKPISQGWPGLPNNIDAAFTYKNGKTYFFKGRQYWRYVGKKMDGDYPKDISEGFTGIPDNLDAAMVWSGNGKIYFFKGTKFWRFDPLQRPPVKSTYPKPLSNWEGIPDNLDAAFQYTNGYTYFFKKGTYYRFNDRNFAVERVKPAFPRSTAWWWFGCKKAPQGTVGNEYSRGSLTDVGNTGDYDVPEKDQHLQHHDVGSYGDFDTDDERNGKKDRISTEKPEKNLNSQGDSAAARLGAQVIILITATLAVLFANNC